MQLSSACAGRSWKEVEVLLDLALVLIWTSGPWGPSCDVLPGAGPIRPVLFFLLCPFQNNDCLFLSHIPFEAFCVISFSARHRIHLVFVPAGFSSLFCATAFLIIPFISLIMQRAFSSRARATALSAAATKYRAGAGLSQQLRFAHKVCLSFDFVQTDGLLMRRITGDQVRR